MLLVTEAQKQILDSFSKLPSEIIKIEHSLNRVLAEAIIADQASPSFDNSSMDGIAVIAADVKNAAPEHPIRLSIIGTIPAGEYPEQIVQSGQAMQIMTGAPLPEGANCVIQVEHTNLDFSKPITADHVLVFHPGDQGNNIRRRGEFYEKDDVLISAGKKIRPQDIAMIAMTGKPSVKVVRKPRVGLLITGDELIPPGEAILPGKIRDTNSYMLAALLENHGAEVIQTGIISDTEQSVYAALQQLFDAKVDLILTSGGVSMGAFDIVRLVIEKHGQLKLWRVNMRPGKPLAFGDFQGSPFIGLPGNPVSAYVGFQVFLNPALQKMQTGSFLPLKKQKAILQDSIDSDGRESYIPATLSQSEGGLIVQPGLQFSSGNLFALIPGNSLIILSHGVKFLNKGQLVDVVKLDLD